MTPHELRAIMAFLRQRVHMKDQGGVAIGFAEPTLEQMGDAGLDRDGARRILGAAWWSEMVTDIVETPEMCDPDDPPEQVLQYARDVVSEYIRKRAEL